MEERITLDHGEGGAATSRLVRNIFVRHLGGPAVLEDAAIITDKIQFALTTDSFVVRPLFFPGGDIGKLSISGTVNDLAVMGAKPRYITAGFIIEEGMEISTLERVVESMTHTAKEAGVAVVTGDTKVVGKGEADGLFINTTGLGIPLSGVSLSSASCRLGDLVLVSGPIGDHGTAIIVARGQFEMSGDIGSDCQPLWDLAEAILKAAPSTHCMRDPTRGGFATILVEIAQASQVGISINENLVPIRRSTRAACMLLGFDPLYMACEGRLVAIVPENQAKAALDAMRKNPRGTEAAIIGQVCDGKGVILETVAGGRRPLLLLEGAQLPRIC
ncbi:MAG: hydrogenase expression/formation protein HypE [Pseudomonadota bacterium]